MALDPTFRPRAKQLIRVVPIHFLLPALLFVSAQLYLAKLTAAAAVALACVAFAAILVLAMGCLAFLRNARVSVAGDGDVTVVDWLGRVRFKVPRAQVRLELLSVQYYGLRRDVAILSERDGKAAAPIWPASWGGDAIRGLARLLREGTGNAAFRLVSKRTFRDRYPQIRLENLPVIGLVVVCVLAVAVAVAVSSQTS
jgi:hypothetical protein